MPNGLEDYEPVEGRLAKFWADHPEGRVETILVVHSETDYIVKALVWRDSQPLDKPSATGWAQETVGSSVVNKTSALENCETSAIGRALANLGYAPKGKRPSREEMSKTSPLRGEGEPSGGKAEGTGKVPKSSSLDDLWAEATTIGLNPAKAVMYARKVGLDHIRTADDLDAGELQALIEGRKAELA